MLELLHDISSVLNGGKLYFNTLTTMEGKPVPMDITKLPEDIQIFVVSYQPPFSINKQNKGIQGNIYDIKDEKDAEAIRNIKNRHGI
jgi:hypothetical protein